MAADTINTIARGGRRDGAGRPNAHVGARLSVCVSVRLSHHQMQALSDFAHMQSVSVPNALRTLLDGLPTSK